MDLVVTNHVTLDSVMQSPAGADEDTRGGFEHGGWAAANADEVMGRAMGERIAGGGVALLFGRRTYEKMAAYWPHQPADNPYARPSTSPTSTSPRGPWRSRWRGTTPPCSKATPPTPWRRKGSPAGACRSWAAATILQSLVRRDLVDRWVLLIHPLVLGTGRRLFPDGGAPARMRLTDSITTTTGVIIATYERP
jgi:dihydrofolate reductase